MIELNANPAPVIPPATVLQDINKCDSGTNNQNGLTTFNLTVQNAGILAAQTGPAANYTHYLLYEFSQCTSRNCSDNFCHQLQ
jgi:hypothetical protein